MKRILSIISFMLLGLVAWSQTLTITPTSVEVVSAGAKTRAFYAIDDVFFTNTAAGGVVVKDASNGIILFNGDTSEVTITGYTLWSEKQNQLSYFCNQLPWTDDVEDITYPVYFLPKKGVNYLYTNNGSTFKIVNSRTKYHLWSGSYTAFTFGCDASTVLANVRNLAFHEPQRAPEAISAPATVTADTAAGTSPTIGSELQYRGGFGEIILTTGSSTKATGVLCVVDLPVSYDVMFITITGRNATSQSHITRVFPYQVDDNTISFQITGTALTAATEYIFDFHVGGFSDPCSD